MTNSYSHKDNNKKRPKKKALFHDLGKLTVITGPMYAGKSDELLKILNRLSYADVSCILFKPTIDTRTPHLVKSRNGQSNYAIEINSAKEIFDHLKMIKHFPFVVGIDEAQFLDNDIVDVIQILMDLKIRVVVSGLEVNSRHQPFGPMGSLLAIAHEVIKLCAICVNCGKDATRTYWSSTIDQQNEDCIFIGNSNHYQARCLECHRYISKKYENEQKELKELMKTLKKEFSLT